MYTCAQADQEIVEIFTKNKFLLEYYFDWFSYHLYQIKIKSKTLVNQHLYNIFEARANKIVMKVGFSLCVYKERIYCIKFYVLLPARVCSAESR